MIFFLVALIVMIPLIILRGFVTSILWDWFLVPLGVPDISVAHAIGLAVFVGLFTSGLAREAQEGEDQTERLTTGACRSLAVSLFSWGVAAIVYYGFMS